MAAIAPGSGGAAATFVDRLRAAGVVPVVEVEDAGRAVALAQALEAGGMPIVEVTFRTEAAAESLRRVAREVARRILDRRDRDLPLGRPTSRSMPASSCSSHRASTVP